ncbi:hypothetical protein [Ktedonospora formicarum]|uniref:Uncharacterized protein n=1 Tax=Ktedonospora formicarum TaxID=2778364 RepID=A0A8J3MTA5_9CHLR|nr:hypothetical protein [Ktedonospora formicarum]GHO46945.1 hypothetical protein KSX_51080 [Ktedonospora formicarum]
MQQRIYYAGQVTPENLADAIVEASQYTRRMRAQKVSGGRAVMVQIGRWEFHHLERAVTVGIACKPDDQRYLVVSLGERDWVNEEARGQAVQQLVRGAVVSALMTPWALFSMASPAARLLVRDTTTERQWALIEAAVMRLGGTLVEQRTLTPPL